jgi:hypothetical protein
MTSEWLVGLEKARTISSKLDLPFWVYNGCLYLQDGGKRGSACADGATYDGVTWSTWGDTSSRDATEEESEMWWTIIRLSGNTL